MPDVSQGALMSFVEPLFLLGLLAAGIPIAIHLINRRKATRQPFPALELLMESQKKEAASIKVRQWLLLALRVLVVALLAFALAKPFFLSEEGVTASERLPTAVVFVVDDSASMKTDDWWENAQDEVDSRLDKLRPWDEVALITTSQLNGPVSRPKNAHDAVRDAFEEIEPGSQTSDLTDALVAAQDALAASQLPSQRIVLVSDFARGGFPLGETPSEVVSHTVEQVNVRDDENTPNNVGVVGVDYRQRNAGQEAVWEINTTLRNFGEEDAGEVQVQLHIDDTNVATGLVDIPAGKTATHTFQHRFEGSGLKQAFVRAKSGDAYDADDRYYFTIRLKDRVRVLLVNGEPTSVAYSDELYFLIRALNPGGNSGESTIVPVTTTPDALATRDLAGFDVLVLANVSSVKKAVADRLEGFVNKGGGLLVSMGDQVDVDAWNKTMAELLPKPLRGLKRLAQKDDPDAPVKITHFGPGQRSHPIFRVFDLPGGASLQSVQVFSYMLLQPSPPEQSETVLSYKDDSPALIERHVGDGRVMLLTTTLDREWTDFPVRTAFLPLMRRAVQYLARRVTSTGREKPVVGEPLELEVTGLVREQAVVTGPDDQRAILEPADGMVSFTPKSVGFYEVWADSDEPRGDSESPRNRLDGLAFSVNVAPEESKLGPLPEGALDAWLGKDEAGEAGEGATATRERRVNLWSPLLFAITL
ncbi:MAG: BatA domain-containing protein, partial [Myxococcota bacterium]